MWIEKTTSGGGYRIWHQCKSYLHQRSSSTESGRENSEDEVAEAEDTSLTILNPLTKRMR